MGLENRFVKTYQLKLNKPRQEVITLVKLNIAESKKNSTWFSFENINYSTFEIADNSIIINRERRRYASNATGTITIILDNNDDHNIATVKVIPLGDSLEALVLVSVIFSLLYILIAVSLVWVYPQEIMYSTLGWLALIIIAYVNMSFARDDLASYAISVFNDLGIKHSPMHH